MEQLEKEKMYTGRFKKIDHFLKGGTGAAGVFFETDDALVLLRKEASGREFIAFQIEGEGGFCLLSKAEDEAADGEPRGDVTLYVDELIDGEIKEVKELTEWQRKRMESIIRDAQRESAIEKIRDTLRENLGRALS